MRKILSFLMILMTVLLCLSGTAASFAEEEEDNFKGEIGDLNVPYAAPVIDGIINTDEGWSEGKYFDRTSIDGCWGGEDPRLSGYLYRAWNDDGLCIAADLTIPDMTLSTDLDAPNEQGKIEHGYNGDVFIITVDPGKQMQLVGMGDEYGPWYCVGIFEGNKTQVYRTQHSEGDITSQVKSAGAVTENGWRFEICIPWDVIIADIETASLDDVQLKKADIAKSGEEVNMTFIYLDRWYDIEMRGVETYSRYASICTTLPDGRPGVLSSATKINTYGIYLHFDAKPGEETSAAETTTSAPETTTAATTAANAGANASPSGTQNGTSASSKPTQNGTAVSSANKAEADTTETAENASAAQTADSGYIIMTAAAILSSAGFFILKSRKNEYR